MRKTKAVIFDIDDTLSPDISWLALTRDLGAPVEQHVQIYQSYKDGKIDYVVAKSRLLALWQSTGNANKTYFAQLFEALPLDDSAASIVHSIKADYIVCLITGSMDLYAGIVARKLAIEQWYANTTLFWNTDGNLVDMEYELDQASKKLKQFNQFCQAHNLLPQECVVVGDGENDEQLFKSSEHGILLSGDVRTKTHVWKQIAHLGDLEQVLRGSDD